MYSKFQLALKYVCYLITASNGKGHGIHSPFVFEFVTQVLNDDRTYYCYQTIEDLRNELKQDNTVISVEDFGAGSATGKNTKRKISAVAHSSLKPKKFSQLLFRMVNFYKPKNILELGTSLGITTAYLASANNNIPVITMEGSKAISDIAQKNFIQLQLSNIKIIEGNFDVILQPTISQSPADNNLTESCGQQSTIDFAFIDGNHRKKPTLQYFQQLLIKTTENSILVFDDVHWSKEMEEAWQAIQTHPAVTLSIDLFFIGIIFFRKEQKATQHFTIRF